VSDKTALWLSVGAGLLLLAGANAHLLYIAVTSQPVCVEHVRSGDGDARSGAFGAAGSACTPPGTGDQDLRRGHS